MEESIRVTEDRDEWRKYVHGVSNLGSSTAKEQNIFTFRVNVCQIKQSAPPYHTRALSPKRVCPDAVSRQRLYTDTHSSGR